jgi:hypothetical protein
LLLWNEMVSIGCANLLWAFCRVILRLLLLMLSVLPGCFKLLQNFEDLVWYLNTLHLMVHKFESVDSVCGTFPLVFLH